jgi:2-isopropylmalate synthase
VTLTSGDVDYTEAAVGNGPVDASYNAVKKILGFSPQLKGFRIGATSERSDAQGETRIVLHYKDIQAQGRGTSTDVIESSIRAYVDAINRLYAAAAAKEIKLNGNDSR